MNNPTETAERTIRDVCAGRPCLSACLARVRSAPPCAACPPQGAARPLQVIRWALAALAAVAVALFACRAFGEVRCLWNGTGYDCSGEGEQIIVYPGGEIGGEGVITNYYGCCTNCTAIAPDVLSNLLVVARGYAETAYDQAGELSGDVYSTIESVDDKLEEIGEFQNSGYLQSPTLVIQKWSSISNYISTVDNGQTRVVRTVSGYPSPSTVYLTRYLTANDAIYFYANNSEVLRLNHIKRTLNDEVAPRALEIENASQFAIDTIDEILPQLAEAPDCSSLSNGCSGVTGRWCTEEQGDAIIKLLGEQVDYLLSISNYLHSVDLHIGGLYRTFMTLRGGIPAEESLDKSWQDIYLSNSTGSFAYGYTNIAERIELLLYGLSGVGTNTQLFTSLNSPVGPDDTAQSEYDRVHSEFEDIDSSFDTGSVNMHSLFGKLQSLFSAFSGLVGRTLAPDETYISNFSFNLGDDSIAVPAVTVGADVSIANQLQTICRGGMIGLYWLVAGILGVKFYIWFFSKVVYFLRWCWELLQGLFS